MSPRDLLALSPQDFVSVLRAEGIRRFYLVTDGESGEVRASHPCLEPLAGFLKGDRRDYIGHEGLFFQISERHETLQGAFVHRTCRGQAAGGVRYWHYPTLEDYLRDGLRLAIGMTRKNALAGLWWGGGKGVMAHNPAVDKDDPEARAALYREYGELMSSLRGCYVTAEDVGTCVEDMARVFSATRFTTCIPPELGGSGNPSVPTARGVVRGMEAALEVLEGGGLEGKTVAIQGTGNVGAPLARFLFEAGVARIVASDIDPRRGEALRRACAGHDLETRILPEDDLSFYETECDIFSPCATGATLNPRTIPLLRSSIVCGAANNQLEDPDLDDLRLHERGILYVPDFLTNRMGIVNCADEQAGRLPHDPLIERHLDRDWEYSVYRMGLKVIEASRASGRPPSAVATEMADELSLEPHPLFGHRGRLIIDGLVAEGWERG
jgi:glutamate dehydrogenase/leucine dehydrogenase